MKRYGKKKTAELKFQHQLTDPDFLTKRDRDELLKFQALLRDIDALGGLDLPKLIDKHGADYLGFTPEEVSRVKCTSAS